MKRRSFLQAIAAAIAGLGISLRPPPVLAQGGLVELVSGWTGNLDFRLLADGAPLNLTGMTVELILTNEDGTLVNTTGDVSVVTPTDGKVRFSPDSTDLLAENSPVLMRWKVTDGVGAVVYHPSGRPAVIVVRPV